jgi:hypothetical protein
MVNDSLRLWVNVEKEVATLSPCVSFVVGDPSRGSGLYAPSMGARSSVGYDFMLFVVGGPSLRSGLGCFVVLRSGENRWLFK